MGTGSPSCLFADLQCSPARRLSLLSASSFRENIHRPSYSTKMAFMAMRRNLDERARRKELDAIFAKFDHNHNGRIYIKDFLAELKDQDIEISQAEVKKIMEFSDREGQLSRSNFESYCRDSSLMKSLDKNHDGIVSELEMTSKHEMAFKVIVEASNLIIPLRTALRSKLSIPFTPQQVAPVCIKMSLHTTKINGKL